MSSVDVGTIEFSYYSGVNVDQNVDVFLNGRDGAKVLSLAPGNQYKAVALDYGNHVIAYRYWTSNNLDSAGETEVGWIETAIIEESEESIYAILNDSRPKRFFVVPHYNTDVDVSQIETQECI